MTAYLDNNIIVDLEQEKISKDLLIQSTDDRIKKFYYSAAHLQEAHEFSGSISERADKLKIRFETISEVTKDNYLFLELPSNTIRRLIESPKVVYDTITDVEFGQQAMKDMVNNVSEEQRELFRNQLGINPKEINNYSPERVIEQINEKKSSFGGYSLVEVIEESVKLHPQGKDFGIHNRIAGIFELLDLVGYWKDKFNEKSNYARLWDSNHAYFSSACDFFISNDKRTRNKAKVAFHLYGINTKVLSSKGEK